VFNDFVFDEDMRQEDLYYVRAFLGKPPRHPNDFGRSLTLDNYNFLPYIAPFLVHPIVVATTWYADQCSTEI